MPLILNGHMGYPAPTADYTGDSLVSDSIGHKDDTPSGDSLIAMCKRYSGDQQHLEAEATITGNGATVLNIFKFTGTIRIISQQAEISEITDITTCSDVYATAYDGTNTVALTKTPGMDLSGVPVGTNFLKDQLASETYSLNVADEIRLNELGATKKVGLAFTLTGKNGVDNYIQFRFTGDANTNFKMLVHFDYTLYNGATLEFA